VDWDWVQCCSVLRLLWLKVIGYWGKLLDILLHKLYLPPDIIRNMEEMKVDGMVM
jgi:hypothetical protein